MGIPGQNPLIPNPLMNFYGFGGIPAAAAGLIPGFNPNLLGQMAMMQQVQAAANIASGSGDTDDIAADSELEEGEISPPRTPTAVPTFPVKKEKSPDVEIIQEQREKELERER